MNIQKFKKLINHIKSLPLPKGGNIFRQSYGIMDSFATNLKVSGDSVCGTVGCIAGEACMMEYPRLKPLEFNGFKVPDGNGNIKGAQTRFFSDEAEEILDISNDGLFYLNEWPLELQGSYKEATNIDDLRESILAQRKVMIQAIRRYMKDPDNFGPSNLSEDDDYDEDRD